MSKARTVSKSVQHTDRKIAQKAGKKRATRAVKTLGKLSEIGDQPPLIALGVATMLGGIVLQRPAVARTGIRMLAAHALATAAKSVVKHRVDRSRPHAWLNGGQYTARRGHSHDSVLNSFPSGHTAGAVAVAAAVARDHAGAAPLAYATAAGIAGMQLPRAQHYLSDIVAGAVIGSVSEWLVSAVMDAGEAFLRRRTNAAAQRG